MKYSTIVLMALFGYTQAARLMVRDDSVEDTDGVDRVRRVAFGKGGDDSSDDDGF